MLFLPLILAPLHSVCEDSWEFSIHLGAKHAEPDSKLHTLTDPQVQATCKGHKAFPGKRVDSAPNITK